MHVYIILLTSSVTITNFIATIQILNTYSMLVECDGVHTKFIVYVYDIMVM